MSKIKTILLALALSCWIPSLVIAEPYTEPFTPVEHLTVQQSIVKYAKIYNVSAKEMTLVMKCESGLNPHAIGDHGTSYGLSQIHLPAHPDISKQQAFDVDFSVEFMAKSFSQGNQGMWTCWKMI